jgi:hypothetical protein
VRCDRVVWSARTSVHLNVETSSTYFWKVRETTQLRLKADAAGNLARKFTKCNARLTVAVKTFSRDSLIQCSRGADEKRFQRISEQQSELWVSQFILLVGQLLS